MPDGAWTPQAYADMAFDLDSQDGAEAVVQKILDYAQKAIGADAAGVTVVHADARMETIGVTNPTIGRLDELQTRISEGPDLMTVSSESSVIVADTEADTRWPAWARAARATGIRSFLNVRMSTYSGILGTLNLYGCEPGQFDRDDQAVAHVIASHAALALNAALTEADLKGALESRTVIGRAQGILMARYGITGDQAFATLKRYSQHHNLKLRVVSQQLVDTGELPEG